MKPTLDIIIVNWNTGRQLYDCLASIAAAGKEGFLLTGVTVVDNASSDDSLDSIESLELPLRILRNAENRGFARASNQGARGATADYLLFLNPDCRLTEESLEIPIRFMSCPENAHVAVCGIQLVDERGTVSRTCARFPTPALFASRMLGLDRVDPARFPSHFINEWDHRESREVDHVIGAFFLVRRSIFERLNGFDERFFLYLEDLDFSYRAHRTGYASHYLAEARAYHKGGGSSEQIPGVRLFYSLRSRIQYGYKHFDPLSATTLTIGTLVVEPVIRVGLALKERSWQRAAATMEGWARLWAGLPDLLKKERE